MRKKKHACLCFKTLLLIIVCAYEFYCLPFCRLLLILKLIANNGMIIMTIRKKKKKRKAQWKK